MRKNARTRSLLNAATVLAGAGVLLLPCPGTGQAATRGAPAVITEGFYQLVNDQTGKCATVIGGTSAANSLPLVQFDCDSHPSRRWNITHRTEGAYWLVNGQTGKCATVAGGTTTANSHPLVQFDCDTHPSRRWYFESRGQDAYRISNGQTGKCATVAGGTTTANSHPLVQFDCDTHPSREWTLRRVG
ncbi:RICIN domain-containing protein [Streptomyces sp. NPDC051582]|uniref:RICIN domain-containing protein n=1 Tax=Streptomyces sp. NPDC051582 TaxID=3155167 RepID=UPI00343C941F